MKSAALGLAAVLAAALSSPTWAQDLKATQAFTETRVGFEAGAAHSNYTLTVTGPNGVHTVIVTKSSPPAIDLRQLGEVQDGPYSYHLTASSDEKVPLRSTLDDGRGRTSDSMLKSVSMSGRFDVKNGVIVKVDPAAREDQKRKQ